MKLVKLSGNVLVCFWAFTMLLAGCVTPLSKLANGCAFEASTSGDDAPYAIHLRMTNNEAGAAVCASVSFNGSPAVTGLVETNQPPPGQARLEPEIPRKYGEFPLSSNAVRISVEVQEWDLVQHQTIQLKPGENWVIVEINKDRITLVQGEEDPYSGAD